MWDNFKEHYQKLGHTAIKRYPVVARWRPDLYFTIASIADFQPFVVSGEIEPPANPLIVPQMCLRFKDISNVGITGRHLTSFIMTGQHAFNSNKHQIYWKNDCLTMNWDYLTKTLGIPEIEMTAIEAVWSGGGNFGPCVEYFCRGLEISNQVFMQYQESGTSYKELETKVIDVGWGHGRLVWASQGTPTAYEGIFGTVLEKMNQEVKIDVDPSILNAYAQMSAIMDIGTQTGLEQSWITIAKEIGIEPQVLRKMIQPLQGLASIADHTRTLTFAIADGAIPSNVGGGYNLRVVLRRALAFHEKMKLPFSLPQVVDWHIDWLKPMFPELVEEQDNIHKILKIEIERAHTSRLRASKLVNDLVRRASIETNQKKRPFVLEETEIIELYESHGVPPEMIQEIASSQNVVVDLPTNIYEKLTQAHEQVDTKALQVSKSKKPSVSVDGLPPVKRLYYEDSHQREFTGKLLQLSKDRKCLVLDQTLFYPEGGGQPADQGTIQDLSVVSVQKEGEQILHFLENPLQGSCKKGDLVKGTLDWQYRIQHMQHHTGTHIVLSATRHILGNHIWQGGSQISQEQARIDVTHYEQLTSEEINQIEQKANEFVQLNAPVTSKFMDRREAEDLYGFRLYQGGVVPGKAIRIIETLGIDVEACGGTHLSNTGEAGLIIINRTKRIQDGVVRIEFSAGKAAINAMQKQRVLLTNTAEIHHRYVVTMATASRVVEDRHRFRKDISAATF